VKLAAFLRNTTGLQELELIKFYLKNFLTHILLLLYITK